MSREKTSFRTQRDIEDKTFVRVNFNYSYTHKSKLIEIFKGEVLELLHKTNEHWWKCLRQGQSKSFYVPALYVSLIEANREINYSTDEEALEDSNGHHQHEHSSRPVGEGKNYGFMFRPESDLVLDDNQSLCSIPSSVVIGDRVTDSCTSLASRDLGAAASSNNSNLSKDTYWSKSLEELARQIVFPGQSSIYFNNPVFDANSNDNLKVDVAHPPKRSPRVSLSSSSTECIDQVGAEGNKSISNASEDDEDGPLPKPEDFIRQLTCNWAEYKSRISQRVYYYNTMTKSKSWKPPRLSKEESNNNVFQIPNGWTQNIDEMNGTVSFVNQATGSKFSDNMSMDKTSSGSENVSRSRIPFRRSRSISESDLLRACFKHYEDKFDVAQLFGQDWYTSTDPSGKIYFYEENSSKSSWFLPDGTAAAAGSLDKPTTSGAATHSQQQDNISSSCDTSEVDDSSKLRTTKRHSTGEREVVLERNNKAVSLFFPEQRSGAEDAKGSTLPRITQSIWADGNNVKIFYENYLNRTRIRENNKKVRKNWASSWGVLTARHLSFFKDPKYKNAQQIKSDLEVDLLFSRLEWTDDKSSRKNVFLITNPNIQLLCQCNNDSDAGRWYSQIYQVITSLVQGDDVVHHFRADSSEYLNSSGNESTVKRRGTSKGGKVPITAPEDNSKSIIRLQLKKFLNRRPAKESLVKKGIYKDEPVFGCTVEQLTLREGRLIPLFVEKCIEVIESKEENLKTDGLYRASGNLSQVQTIRYQVDLNKMDVLEKEEDVHVLAGSLKLFFREMREPLLPSSTFTRFLSACQLPREQKLREFKSLLSALPKPNHATLKRLLEHMLKVSQYSEFNRMQIANLAIVFGPTVMWNSIESINMATDLMQQNYVVEILLSDFSILFS